MLPLSRRAVENFRLEGIQLLQSLIMIAMINTSFICFNIADVIRLSSPAIANCIDTFGSKMEQLNAKVVIIETKAPMTKGVMLILTHNNNNTHTQHNKSIYELCIWCIITPQ